MFRIDKKTVRGVEFIELRSSDSSTKLCLCLNKGGSVDKLKIKNRTIITNLHPIPFNKCYPSSILFPFVNRIKDGVYNFKNKKYQFYCNEKSANNAIHGLVYNKYFHCIREKLTSKYASIKLCYEEVKINDSFPFYYRIELNYKLTRKSLELRVKIINTGKDKFPFTVGWHPYFKSYELSKSNLLFSTNKKLLSDSRKITIKVVDCNLKMPFSLKNKTLDDAYILNDNTVEFSTSKYDLKLSSSQNENYLQLYTPKDFDAIAIEPMTGISDSFNNKIGLKELSPKKSFEITWSLDVIPK